MTHGEFLSRLQTQCGVRCRAKRGGWATRKSWIKDYYACAIIRPATPYSACLYFRDIQISTLALSNTF